jgi:hypothetical protein
MGIRFTRTAVIIVLVAMAFSSPLHAQWQENGVTVAAATGEEEAPKIAPDGAGGAIIVWQTVYRTPDIYAQRLDADGYLLWTAGGVPVCTATNGQHKPEIVTDGAGGAIIAWSDFRNGNADIYAQRLDPAGNPLWTAGGIAVCTVADTFGWWMLSRVRLVPHEGGVIMAWHDNRSGNDDIYAQRIDANGNILWTPNGVTVCTAFGDQNDVEMIADGSGGAIIVWKDGRSDEGDIYAQRIAADSTVSWPPNGAPVCTAAGEQEYHAVTTDGEGGAIVCWMDGDWETSDIYAQRVSAEGLLQWPPRGRPVCTAIKQQAYPDITPDCFGGAFIAWSDQRNDVWYDHDIYAQRVDHYGLFYWTTDGVKISEHQSKDHLEPRIIQDGYGGAILTWWCGEPLPGGGASRATVRSNASDNETVYAQRIMADSTALWEEHGIMLCTYAEYMTSVRPRLVTDEAGGTIVTWCNIINHTGIYAQRVNANGNAPPTHVQDPPVTSFLAQNHPNPFNPTTTIRFGLTRPEHVRLAVYDILGRLVRVLIDDHRDAAVYEVRWNGTDDAGCAVASGVYFYALTAGEFGESRKLVLLR